MSFVVAAVVSGGATLGAAYIGSKAAGAQADAINNAAATEAQLGMEQLDFGKEQWQMYVDKIMPLEMEAAQQGIDARQLALQRGQDEYEMYTSYYRPMQIKMSEIAMDGTEDRTAQVTRDAAVKVRQQFEQMREINKRNLERSGVRPTSGRSQTAERQIGLQEAATSASEQNRAREDEQNRQETTNFNMLASATGRAPTPQSASQSFGSPGLNPSAAMNTMAGGRNMIANSSMTAANAAGMKQNYMANAIPGLVDAASGIQSAYSTYNAGVNPTFSYEQANNFQGNLPTPEPFGPQFKDGGEVPPANGNAMVPAASPGLSLIEKWRSAGIKQYANGGEVSGPPGVDNVPAMIDGRQPAAISSGEYIIPKDVKEAKGTEFFDKLIEQYHEGPAPTTAGVRG